MKRLFTLLFVLVVVPALAANEIPTAAPEEVGLSSTTLAEIRPAMQRYIDENKLAGIITVVARSGRVARFESVGMMDVEAGKPMRDDTIVRMYSMSKPITSVAVMMLYEKGAFDLDDPVSKHLPELKGLKVVAEPRGELDSVVDATREMTVRDLLRHTSGLTYGFFGTTPVDRKYVALNVLSRDGNLEDMTRKLGTIPLLHQPGTVWNYSVSVDVLGRLVEVLSGLTLAEFLDKRIFEPLDMHDTAFHVASDKLDRFAANYGPGDAGLRLIDDPASSPFARPTTFYSGGGGLTSTARDYLRFAQMVLNGGHLGDVRILNDETVQMMTQNQLPPEAMPIGFGPVRQQGVGFGLGFSVRVEATGDEPAASVGEYGWGGAASTNFWIVPREQIIGISLTQYMPLANQYDREFRQIVYRAITDPVDADSPSRQPAAAR